MELFLIVKKGFKICFNRDSGKNKSLVTWWDRFRFGCKTLKGVFWNSTPTKFLIKPLNLKDRLLKGDRLIQSSFFILS
ncbi:hypothetical protein BD0110_05560 [Helicobacter pylori]